MVPSPRPVAGHHGSLQVRAQVARGMTRGVEELPRKGTVKEVAVSAQGVHLESASLRHQLCGSRVGEELGAFCLQVSGAADVVAVVVGEQHPANPQSSRIECLIEASTHRWCDPSWVDCTDLLGAQQPAVGRGGRWEGRGGDCHPLDARQHGLDREAGCHPRSPRRKVAPVTRRAATMTTASNSVQRSPSTEAGTTVSSSRS